MHPEDHDRALQEFESVRTTGYACFGYRFKCADGRYRWFQEQPVLSYDRHGKPIEITGTIVDVDAQKRAEDTQKFLLRELDHRVKNTLAAVESIALLKSKRMSRYLVELLGDEAIVAVKAREAFAAGTGVAIGTEEDAKTPEGRKRLVKEAVLTLETLRKKPRKPNLRRRPLQRQDPPRPRPQRLPRRQAMRR